MGTLVALVAFVMASMLLIVAIAFALALPATFTTRTYPLPGNTHVAADVNSDGKLDLAGSGANSADVRLNNGDGTFRPEVSCPSAGQTQAIEAGDFNAGGNKDLAIDAENTGLYTLPRVGDCTFVQKPACVLVPGDDLFSASNDVAFADHGRDAIQDLAVAPGNGDGTAILIGNGHETVYARTTSTSGYVNPYTCSSPDTPPVTPTRPPTADTHGITRAGYASGNRELRIEAANTGSNAVLTAYVTSTNQLIGTLSNHADQQGRREVRGALHMVQQPTERYRA